jgi:glycosyltransferase involved in cell wall biosynthesis/predicted O-methyltransferase YrrM
MNEVFSQPLVSCLMPTYNRRRFIPHALEYFFNQGYANRELIILDDGTDAINDLVPADERILYVRLDKKIPLGAKLNLACEYARGEIMAHWDDDDWYAPTRLSYQVAALAEDRIEICGINTLLYYDLLTGRAYQYVYPREHRVWLLGSELCYRKRFWETHRFVENNVGMDARFVWSADPRSVLPLGDHTFAVHMIHQGNVSPKKTEGSWWHPYSVEAIAGVLGADWEFYKHDGKTPNGCPRARTTRTETITVNDSLEPIPQKETGPVRNVFACLVHESQECVIDLVRSLRYHDPDSVVLLYNGGNNPGLLNHGFPFERYGAVVHPTPRQMKWGWLHGFALDSMKFALDNFSFDTLTIVDSDQIALRPGYSQYLSKYLSGLERVGMLGNSPGRQTQTTRIAPAVQAWREFELWRPWLQRFPRGEQKFVHWTFWPSTVFTRDSMVDLVNVFAKDKQLNEIIGRSKIWATEEVILPTLVALLGYKIGANPCSYDCVKYRARYSSHQIETALARPDVFWVHPVTRTYGDALRKLLRAKFHHYERTPSPGGLMQTSNTETNGELLLTWPILSRMRAIEGWLEDEEADLLIALTARALTSHQPTHSIVEVGSYCGRSTVVFGSVVRSLSPTTKIYAIDPHDGKVGALDQGITTGAPTFERFSRNIEAAGLTKYIEPIRKYSYEVKIDQPIEILFIDGLHDYANVARDFFQFEAGVVPGGFIAFHDYADYYPGVKSFVNEILASGRYRQVASARSMVALKKLNAEASIVEG